MAEGRLGHFIKLAREKARSPSVIYLLAAGIGRVGGFFLIPIYTRRLTPAEYGTYALFISLLGLFPQIFTLGLNAGLAKAYFDGKDDERGTRGFGAVARGLFVTAGLWTILGAAVSLVLPGGWLSPLSRWHALLLVVGAFGAAATNTAECYYRIREKAIWASAFPLANFLVMAALGVGLVVGVHRNVNGAVEAPAIAALVVGLFSAGFVMLRIHADPIYPATKRALIHSIPFVFHYISYWVQSAGDRWVLSLFDNSSALGMYFLAVQLMSPISMVIQAWSQGIWPPMGRVYRDEGLVKLKAMLPHFYKRGIQLSVVTAVGIHLCMPILSIVVGPKFLGALKLMPWLAIMMVFDSLYYPAQTVIYYAGRSKLIPLIASTTTFGGLAISALLVPRLGVNGLLIGRGIAATTSMIAFCVAAARVTDAGGNVEIPT